MLSKDDIVRGLRAIDQKARNAGVVVDLSIYGGAAMALVFDLRQSTKDVDAVVRGSPEFLRTAAREVAAAEGWPNDWLNDGVKGFTSAKEQMQLMADFSESTTGGLRVFTPIPEYLFAMKCMAMRQQGLEGSHDISDIEALADAAKIVNVEEALSLVESFYPREKIPAKVRFGIEEIMERVVAKRTRPQPGKRGR